MASDPLTPPDPSLPPAVQAGVSAREQALAQLRALGYSRVPKAAPLIRGRSVSAAQAAMGSGTLGQLVRQAQQAQACLRELRSVLPPALLSLVQSGPIEGDLWTLLVSQPAAAAKIRQFVPALAAHVRTKGWPIQRIEVKIHRP
jgi:hypothetical protein